MKIYYNLKYLPPHKVIFSASARQKTDFHLALPVHDHNRMATDDSFSGVLSDTQILHHLQTTGNVVIQPFYQDQLSNSSYDVTLGEYFYSENLDGIGEFFNPWNPAHVTAYWGDLQTAETVTSEKLAAAYGCKIGDRVIKIASGSTILAHTNEFIGGRRSITTMMKARSSMGRCMISICKCAGWGDIGYVNRWTMEIQNTSRTTAILIVGQKIGQIVFFTTGECMNSYEVRGSYQKPSAENIDALIKAWKPSCILPKVKRISDRSEPVCTHELEVGVARLPSIPTPHASTWHSE